MIGFVSTLVTYFNMQKKMARCKRKKEMYNIVQNSMVLYNSKVLLYNNLQKHINTVRGRTDRDTDRQTYLRTNKQTDMKQK